ncbi:hypothetical protein DCO57_15170 [Labrenzia sp. 011]|nr:hypothetical protein DCO57_15170 [Labrenzia sp. 011]
MPGCGKGHSRETRSFSRLSRVPASMTPDFIVCEVFCELVFRGSGKDAACGRRMTEIFRGPQKPADFPGAHRQAGAWHMPGKATL